LLVKDALNNGGSLHPLILPHSVTGGVGVMNPSVFVNSNNEIFCNIRVVNYALYHSRKHPHKYGPLQYLHEEDNIALDTFNVLAKLDQDLNIVSHHKVDTSANYTPPAWNFTGLEDARLVEWDEETFLIGVRRDVKSDGEGRMEMSALTFNSGEASEDYRTRMEPPVPSYCEKNWMPILDWPHHFVKWTSPTEIVKHDANGKCETVRVLESRFDGTLRRDLRGGSQLVPFKDGYLALTHDSVLYKTQQNQKDATYLHRFVFFNIDLELTEITDTFTLLGGDIEFCCGLAAYEDDLLISFGYQDSSAFILKISKEQVSNIIWKS